MTDIFLGFLNRSLAAGILILAVVLVRLVFKKAPRWLLCALWALAAVRLVCPVSIESVLSLIPSAEPVQPEIIVSAQPAITSGIPAVDAIVNPPLAAAFTPSPAQSANPLQIWTFLAACVWLAGIAALLLYAAVSALRLRLRVRTAVRLEGKVYQSEFVSSPFILGVIRPHIYLPFGLEAGAQAMVLAHERAHLRRGDQLWKPLGYLILAAYWFNPLCWLAYILFCRDIEAACDEKVVRELGEGCKAAYSRALLACSVPRKLITACPLAFGETGVKSRIKSVLNYKKPAFWLVLAAVLVSAAVAVCFLTDPKREDPAQNPPAAEEAAAQAPAQSIDASSAPEPAIDEQAGLDPDFFTGTDGYGNSVTVQALFTAATESGGGDWGAYIPAEGWLRNLGSRLWYSEKTGASFEVVYYPSVPVSSQIASYDAGGYDGLTMTRCTVYALSPESAVYLYGAEGGCFEVRIHWDQGENRTDASGYNSYLQSCFEEPLLRKMAMSFYPLNADGTAQKRTMLAQAGGYTLFVRTEAADCPYGDESCHLHTKTLLSCETADGTEHLLDGPSADTTYWFMHYDAGGGFLRVGCLSQDPAHGQRFSTWFLDIFVPELRIGLSTSYTNVSLSGENPAAPEEVATDSTMPIQPCELTLPNGVYLGLDYETTLQLAQAYRGSRVYRGQSPGDNFTVDGVSYYFSADSSGVLRLDSYSVITTELATQSFLRGIKLGDGLQSVLDTIPTADWLPEQLYSQLLYGEDLVSGDRAVLDWSDSTYRPSNYTLRIKSGTYSANIKFDHDGSVSGIYVSNY